MIYNIFRFLFSLLFVSLFIIGTIYIIDYETERYESHSIINIRDLTKEKSSNPFDMVLGEVSTVMKESKLLDLYMRSGDMFIHLNMKFNFTEYYSGKEIDILRRLSKDSTIPSYQLNQENLIKSYNEDLSIVYDESSTALLLGFSHAKPEVAREIVRELIRYSSYTLNRLERENSQVALDFLQAQVKENELVFIASIKNMIKYQNKHNTIDPNLEVQAKSTILANLESELIKKNVEFSSSAKFMVKNSIELKVAKRTIQNLGKEIQRVKNEIAGSGTSRGELNDKVFDYKILKNEITFAKEIYSHALAQLEGLKSQVNQNIKNLLIISKPSFPELYTYPEKPKRIFTLFIILFFIYSILASMMTLIKEHRD
jgi:capsular polysaccharide transport system permease protein